MSELSVQYDVVVAGAGAAGLMCAIEAGKRGRRVLVLEHQEKIGKKILISGGGRCNFTNLHAGPKNFVSRNPDFCRSALSRFKPDDFIELVKKHQIEFYEKTLGQLFCRHSSKQIVSLLQSECSAAGVEIRVGCTVQSITSESSGFTLTTPADRIRCDSLVVATGGLSIPKIGASSWGYDLAKQFGHRIVPCKPALVPFIWNSTDQAQFGHLSGTSFDGVVSVPEKSFREKVLFTHHGLSGPAILQISNYWTPHTVLTINTLPDVDPQLLLRELRGAGERRELATALGSHLPQRVVDSLCDHTFAKLPLASISNAQIDTVRHAFSEWTVVPATTAGFDKAEVTRGGVDTTEISSKSFESNLQRGLFFVGEVLDVTGELGGYNFQWAWSSGFAAGQFA